MKEIILRWTTWVHDEINEETGEIITPSHSETRHKRFYLENILEMQTKWNGIAITFIDGHVFETDDSDIHIFYR